MLVKIGRRAICLEEIVQIVPLQENGRNCVRLSFSGHEAYILYEHTFPEDYQAVMAMYDAIPRIDPVKYRFY